MDVKAKKMVIDAQKALASAVLYMVTQFEDGSIESDMGHELYPVVSQFDHIRQKYALEEVPE